jgi:hypothetical protein
MEELTADEPIGEIAKRLGVDEPEVRKIVDDLGTLKGPAWGLASDNRDHFDRLRNWTKRGLEILQKMPAHVLYEIFASEVSKTLDTLDDETLNRLDQYLVALENLHDRCDQLITAWKPGVHGGFGWREHQAAIAAYLLLEKHGKPITQSKDGDFFVITGLLFRAAWGGPVKDMRRACEAALSAPIRTK